MSRNEGRAVCRLCMDVLVVGFMDINRFQSSRVGGRGGLRSMMGSINLALFAHLSLSICVCVHTFPLLVL
jgi:hypothetical protein